MWNGFGRIVFRPVWVVLGLIALPFLLGATIPLWVQYVPFLASVLVLGLPHGAVDHLAVARVGEPTTLRRSFVVVSLAYLLLGGAYLLSWVLVPAPSFVAFIVLTWVHWGQGDLYVFACFPETHLRSRLQRVLTVVVRGGLPMVVPLLAFPELYREVARAVIGLFDPNATMMLSVLFAPATRFALGTVLAGLSVGTLILGFRRIETPGEYRAWRTDTIETGLLWGFFLTTPPILAVGLYFCVWHSLRHIVRVIMLAEERTDTPSDESATGGTDTTTKSRSETIAALARFMREAAPLTAGALVIFAGLYIMAPVNAVSGFIGLYLVLLAVLTLPHVLVVTWMDRKQGVW